MCATVHRVGVRRRRQNCRVAIRRESRCPRNSLRHADLAVAIDSPPPYPRKFQTFPKFWVARRFAESRSNVRYSASRCPSRFATFVVRERISRRRESRSRAACTSSFVTVARFDVAEFVNGRIRSAF